MLRPVNVARAAPVTPVVEMGPRPKMKQGSRIKLRMLDTQSKRMAMAASPAPRKMALLRKSMSDGAAAAKRDARVAACRWRRFGRRAHERRS